MPIRKNGSYKAILVDFFDTLVFRHVTASASVERWAICMKKKYPELAKYTSKDLSAMRHMVFRELRERILTNDGKTEVTYDEAIGGLYDRLSKELVYINKDTFITTSKHIDLGVEIGCVYANNRFIKELKKEKERGIKLYIVSDFYLPKEDIQKILFSIRVPEDLFEGIFISCDIGKRKAVGDAFPFILDQIGLEAGEVKMIGDNRISDFKIPASLGIHIDYHPRLAYKCLIHLKDALKIDFAHFQSRLAVKEMYRRGMDYSEYIYMFYIFTKRLFNRLKEENISYIAFMAREGYYLKDLFELYQSLLIPEQQNIRNSYYLCSRRSVMSGIRNAHMPDSIDEEISIRNWLKSIDISLDQARQYTSISNVEADESKRLEESTAFKNLMNNTSFVELFNNTIASNKKAFVQYTKDFIKDGVFRFVDSGWKCTTQNAIQNQYCIDTEGYYIGVQKPDKPIAELKCSGLIFCEEKPRSRYYDYLGTNIPFYQQLLAAPHGTVLKYIFEEDEVVVKCEWDPMEEKLYHEKIEKLQSYMKLKFMGLCSWDDKDAFDQAEDWFLAKSAMKSSLFAHGTRLSFIKECTDNYVQNFRQEKRGKVQYDIKKVKIGPDILWRPEQLIRYFGKVQRTSLYDKRLVRVIYPMSAYILYAYTILLQVIKNLDLVFRNGK